MHRALQPLRSEDWPEAVKRLAGKALELGLTALDWLEAQIGHLHVPWG